MNLAHLLSHFIACSRMLKAGFLFGIISFSLMATTSLGASEFCKLTQSVPEFTEIELDLIKEFAPIVITKYPFLISRYYLRSIRVKNEKIVFDFSSLARLQDMECSDKITVLADGSVSFVIDTVHKNVERIGKGPQ